MSDENFPENIDHEIADLLVAGREFDVGPKRFKVRRVSRGSMAHASGSMIPLVRQDLLGVWHLGLYEDPERDSRSPLLVAFELDRIR